MDGVDGDDSWMGESGCDFGLVHKPILDPLVLLEVGAHLLEGYISIAEGVMNEKNLSHAALANRANSLVTGNLFHHLGLVSDSHYLPQILSCV